MLCYESITAECLCIWLPQSALRMLLLFNLEGAVSVVGAVTGTLSLRASNF